jgi:hypothetical protein
MNHWFRLLLALVLTLWVTQHGVRYEALSQFSPSPWASDVRLQSQPTLSALDSAPGAWRLEAADQKAHRGLSWQFPVPPGAQAVRVQARVDIADVVQGPKRWERASVALRQVAEQAKPRERSVFGETGTLTQEVDEVHPLLPGAESVQLLVRLLRASGSMEVHGLQLSFVAERSGMGWVVVGVWLVWVGGFAGLGWAWLHGVQNRWLPVVGAALVLSAVTLPGAWRDALAQWLVAGPGFSPALVFHPMVNVAVHGLMFGLAAVLLALNRPDWSLTRCLAELGLLAACSEVVQKLVPGRSAEWFDLRVDLVGVALGLSLVWAWREGGRPWLRRRRHGWL